MNSDGIIAALKRYGVPHERIASVIGRDRTAATKMLNGTRSVKASEIEPLAALIAEFEAEAGDLGDRPVNRKAREDFDAGRLGDYVAIEVMPTYAGMGGGGNGDGEHTTTLVSRRLVEDELGMKPAAVLMINVRGNSMEPLFFHGDQLLIDRNDRSPTQAGPFALRYGDEYVVKNVRWIDKRTRLRVWSQNEAVGGEEIVDPDEIDILGRPVWFARRL